MPLIDQIQKDIVAAMKAREEHRLSTLRMVKTALKNREIEKMAPLDDKESQQVLSTLIKQRKDSVEQFTKGGRQEMADKEAAEIKLIEAYLPKEAGGEEVVAGVRAAMAEMTGPLTMKDMGAVMKAAMARFAAGGMRLDGKVVSVGVKMELAGKYNRHGTRWGGRIRPPPDERQFVGRKENVADELPAVAISGLNSAESWGWRHFQIALLFFVTSRRHPESLAALGCPDECVRSYVGPWRLVRIRKGTMPQPLIFPPVADESASNRIFEDIHHFGVIVFC